MTLNKREWFLVIFFVFFSWTLDYYTKQWALTHVAAPKLYHGFFGLGLHRNPGAMLGMLSDIPAILRIVSLSTGGAFLIFTYFFIQYLLPKRFFSLRIGLSLFLGGILGNVTDRILWGSVVDFIFFKIGGKTTPVFNIADAIQWVGCIMCAVALYSYGHNIWPDRDSRKKVWVMPKYQFKYIFLLISIGIGFSIISGVFSYTYLQITIHHIAVGSSDYLEKKFLYPFALNYLFLTLLFVLALFALGRILSHRTAGPIYAFELFLKDTLQGKKKVLKLRSGDEMLHLEKLANTIGGAIHHLHELSENHDKLKSEMNELKKKSNHDIS